MLKRDITITGNIAPSLLVSGHPKEMFYREATQNCIEASVAYKKYHPELTTADIHIRKLDISGLLDKVYDLDDNGFPLNSYKTTNYKDKLSFLNYGGMGEAEFSKILDIGGSGKETGLGHNFGIGIKTSVVNWSDLLFITYKADTGLGLYAVLTKVVTSGIDFKIQSKINNEHGYDDCTDWIIKNATDRGYDLKHDFTEVVILGKDTNQDTFLHTFDSTLPKLSVNHIKENLSKRYFNLPSDIKIKIHPSANRDSGSGTNTITFTTFNDAFLLSRKNHTNDSYSEVVPVPNANIKIHYFWDAPIGNQTNGTPYKNSHLPGSNMWLNTSGWPNACSGFVWKNEIYDPQVNRSWRAVAPYLSIRDKFAHFRFFVEYLDVDSSITTDMYRVKLFENNEPLSFSSIENLQLIVNNMPEFIKLKIAEAVPLEPADTLEDLKDLAAEYDSLNKEVKSALSGNIGNSSKRGGPSNNQSNSSGGSGSNGNGSTQTNFTSPQPARSNQSVVPEFRKATDNDIDMMGIKDHFAYVEISGILNPLDTVYYNTNYDRIDQLAANITEDMPMYKPDAVYKLTQLFIREVALWIMTCRKESSKNKINITDVKYNFTSKQIDTHLSSCVIRISREVSKYVKTKKAEDEKQIVVEEYTIVDEQTFDN